MTTEVDQIRGQVEAFQAALDRLQALSEGQFDQAISDLRAAANEVAQSAVSTGQEAVETAARNGALQGTRDSTRGSGSGPGTSPARTWCCPRRTGW